ncbi:hypothetical protein HPHPP25C_1205 [Helicobacter pylori Hp P-25c]|uniref:Uncharacterized protein n=1 Tax=Helicobacter pylori GAM120Ai TaxID=1159029 RepID=A0AAV3IGT9_HELPX|nr:hypothetical protein HPHPP25C_1205 [Helicobacter pylori Hp P-25c]EJC36909.1 hypothetical protein HPHPP25D_1392 [Helicobacter pylori Hp P-25d]EMG96704.1 hypothetical protein HMPREF1401_00429 [Helicobacter pylori GAM120Ai]
MFKTWIKSIENLKNKKVLFSSKWVTKTFYGGYSVFLALVVSF